MENQALIEELTAALAERHAAAAGLREAKRQWVVALAQAETAVVKAAGGVKALGSNAAEQERALTLALADDDTLAAEQVWAWRAEDLDRVARDRVEVARAVIALATAREG